MIWGGRLLAGFRAGDRAALDEVYRTHADSIVRVVAMALRRYKGGGPSAWVTASADLPDLVQEVFARAFDPRTRRSFDGSREYGPFLAQIARNVTVDYLRRRGRQASVDLEQVFATLDTQAVPDPTADFADRQTMDRVARYLRQLPPDLQRAHDMLYVRGLSEREAAAALGIGRQVIRTLGARLREGLRRALSDDAVIAAAFESAASETPTFPPVSQLPDRQPKVTLAAKTR